jgi:transglutaminase-like putative cysteine protease
VLQAYQALPPGTNPRTAALAAEMRAACASRTSRADTPAWCRPRCAACAPAATPTRWTRACTADTADEFWFDRKEGFCEHIASAFVVLMRGLGIPSRIVTGYQGGEFNNIDGYWVVRQSDAHAWAEVWLEGPAGCASIPTGSVSPGRTGQFQRLRRSPG